MHHSLRNILVVSLFALFSSVAGEVWAGGCGCHLCAAYQAVEKTVYVPTMVPEKRIVHVVECRPEVHERTVTVARCVPETTHVTETCIVMVPQTTTRTVKYYVKKPTYHEIDQQYTVMVPHQEVRQGVRMVCRPVQVTEMRTVCKDMGHWERVVCNVPCRCGCGYTQVTRKVWRPNVVTHEVPVTVCRTELVQEKYDYTVTVCRPEINTRKVRVCNYVLEEKTKEVPCTVYVPQKQERSRPVTTYKTVYEKQTQHYTVMKPYTVEKEVDVMVCRMVPKTVVCHVPIITCGPCW